MQPIKRNMSLQFKNHFLQALSLYPQKGGMKIKQVVDSILHHSSKVNPTLPTKDIKKTVTHLLDYCNNHHFTNVAPGSKGNREGYFFLKYPPDSMCLTCLDGIIHVVCAFQPQLPNLNIIHQCTRRIHYTGNPP